jgi:dihydroorotate dehydrogenase electron transfer subunit
MPGTFLLSLTAPELCSRAKPGQFIMVDCGEDFTLRRPVSIHNCNGRQLQILVRVCGAGSSSLAKKSNGDTIDILGPQGNGYSLDPGSKNILLIAGGIGIAPIAFMANHCIAQKKQVTLLMGAASSAQLYPSASINKAAKVVKATDDGSAGYKGLVTDMAKEYIPQADQVFACGPLPMYVALAGILKSAKPRGKFQVSVETRMGCGFGICYGCTIKTASGIKQVCSDGPVFDIEEIDWDWLKIR